MKLPMKNLYIITILSFILASCATYNPKPIIDSEISKALSMPSQESINEELTRNNKNKSF
jgi:hypothetical protein